MIVLNEKVYAEECLKRKSVCDKPFYTLSILAKYYYYYFNYRKKKITELLTEFMKESYPRYECNKSSWDENIEKIAKNVGKYNLYEIDGVWITKSEFETIENIHNKVLERLAFTLLCLAKLNNEKSQKNSGWVNNDAKEVFSLARISCSIAERYEKLGMLHQLSLLEFARKIENLSCRVTYINDDSEKILFVSDFRELGYEYLKYIGGLYSRCQECGRLFKVNKKNIKYCSLCQASDKSDEKNIICIDCGKVFTAKKKNNLSCRCKQCQEIKNKENKKNWYENKKNEKTN